MDVTNSRLLERNSRSWRYFNQAGEARNLGLTLIEVLTALAVASILFGIGVPGISSVMETSRLTSQINLLSGAMAYTRSIAVQRNQTAVICKSSTGSTCTPKSRWEQGWIIFADSNENRELDVENGDQILRIQSALPAATLRYRAFGPRGYIAYQPSGFTQTNGTFTLCFSSNSKLKKALILSKSGRLRVSDTGYGGKPLKCP